MVGKERDPNKRLKPTKFIIKLTNNPSRLFLPSQVMGARYESFCEARLS